MDFTPDYSRDLEKIQEMYDLGQEDATKKMDALDVYLKV